MSFQYTTLLITLSLFVGMLVLLEVGRRLGMRRLASDPDGALAGTGTIEGAVYALLGLLIAFTFSGAATRFDERRALIIQETNDIGTAYLRIDLFPAVAQPALRDAFRRYVDARLAVYANVADLPATEAALARANALQGDIWNQAIAAGKLEGATASATMLMVPALNQMFDVTTTRTMATRMHPPTAIFALLYALALASALLAGYGMAASKTRSVIHMLGYAAITAVAINLIIDIEFPRLGLIRVDAFDQALVDLRAGMK